MSSSASPGRGDRTGVAVDSNFFTAPEFESMNLASGSSTKGIPCVKYALF
jgi:hypothetical protein